ncbi:MAG TPA: beta-N-acetylhexosaminidase [Candidatus Competibacteraceae bacterium]|nr:beta-N-acetylhexosaminidase [Candidatus Competibacteraceae bacterium]
MSLGPLMLGVEGLALSAEERDILRHPLVGGVILFSRNYHDPEQLTALVTAIHALRQPRLLVGVDQEGGRVQRFRDGFTRLPAPRRLGEIYDHDRIKARQLARVTGWLMAAELRAVGVDFSFAPVLDLDWGKSAVIGDRALHRNPEAVAELAHAYMSGMQKAGMEAVGKHFPGHGFVAADSHHVLPVDARDYADIAGADLVAFERMVRYGLAGIMPAHVVYPCIDAERSAGFSPLWLQRILRQTLGFRGAIFSDDLDMAAAVAGGDPLSRARAALAAGCDMLLCCNERATALAILRGLEDPHDPVAHLRLARFHGRGKLDRASLQRSQVWRRAARLVQDYDAFPLLDMDI